MWCLHHQQQQLETYHKRKLSGLSQTDRIRNSEGGAWLSARDPVLWVTLTCYSLRATHCSRVTLRSITERACAKVRMLSGSSIQATSSSDVTLASALPSCSELCLWFTRMTVTSRWLVLPSRPLSALSTCVSHMEHFRIALNLCRLSATCKVSPAAQHSVQSPSGSYSHPPPLHVECGHMTRQALRSSLHHWGI